MNSPVGTTLLCLLMGSLCANATPMVPGYENLATGDKAGSLIQGEILLAELNCLACHSPGNAEIQERFNAKTGPHLGEIGARATPQYLRKFLENPHGIKPGTTMPDMFHSSDPESKRRDVDFLVHFLAAQGGPINSDWRGGTPAMARQGEQLFHSVGCIACHAPADVSGISTPVIPLGNLALKTSLAPLTEFLLDPLKVRKSGRMPSLSLKPEEARAIAMYLLQEQFDNPQLAQAGPVKSPGLAFDYYELSGNVDRLPDFSQLTPNASGMVETFTLDLPTPKRESNFGVRFRGLISVAETGAYRFSTRSDDGSKLFINGVQVVDNDGTHGMENKSGTIQLPAGDHLIEVIFFQAGGGYGLNVFWSGPGIPRRNQEIPADVLWNSEGTPMIPIETELFTLDLEKADMGKRMFVSMACIACHDLDGLERLGAARPLARLNPARPNGCLGDNIRKGVPDFKLSPGQKSALKLALENREAFHAPLSSAEKITRTMAALNCYACHERDGSGGPDPVRAEWFQSTSSIDLGEEGKIPPALTGIGAKLKPDAMERILLDGELHVRHYMATRMPLFGEANLRTFLDAIGEADHREPPGLEPEFTEASWKIGHKLAGVTGMACVTCHNVSGQKALGIQGIDLATVNDRVNPGWFKKFLLDPAAFKKETRMPQFWPDGESAFKDLAGGDVDTQIDGIWSYLSLRKSMPLPEGLEPEGTLGMELIPAQEPIVHRTFMNEVGPRAIVAGYPEKVHVAFDANVVRLAKAWRGRFFDAAGVASGRTEQFFDPLGEDVLNLPAGPAFAILESLEKPWPIPAKTDRNLGGQFRGYYLDAEMRPVFQYRLNQIEIEEQPVPLVQAGGAVLTRRFFLKRASAEPGPVYFLAAAGDSISRESNFIYAVDGKLRVHLNSDGELTPLLRQQANRTELLVPVHFQNGQARIEATLQW
jgi:mono/diheme cytochrome c family protein